MGLRQQPPHFPPLFFPAPLLVLFLGGKCLRQIAGLGVEIPPGCDRNSGLWGHPGKGDPISRGQAGDLVVGEESLRVSTLAVCLSPKRAWKIELGVQNEDLRSDLRQDQSAASRKRLRLKSVVKAGWRAGEENGGSRGSAPPRAAPRPLRGGNGLRPKRLRVPPPDPSAGVWVASFPGGQCWSPLRVPG